MYQRILVPIDGSATSAAGLDEAIRLARLTGGRLHLIHVIDELSVATGFDAYGVYGLYGAHLMPSMKQTAERVLVAAKATAVAAGVAVETTLIETMSARVSTLVADAARTWNADLIVLGTHGRRGVGRLVLGSDAEQILRCSPVPVLLVRPASAEASKTATVDAVGACCRTGGSPTGEVAKCTLPSSTTSPTSPGCSPTTCRPTAIG